MHPKYDILQPHQQDQQQISQEMAVLLETFLLPLLVSLDRLLDKRLIRTFVQCCVGIIRFRNNKQGLWLSELGSYLQGHDGLSIRAAAGTKRMSNLLRSLKWRASHIDEYLLHEADKEVQRLKDTKKHILCLWDGSVIEKAESRSIEGICPVVSSKAKRLSRSTKGLVFNMPAVRPIVVAGMHWTGALIAGYEGVPKIALMSWWSTRGVHATKTRQKEEALLRTVIRKWSDSLLHVFDRGYASGPWIQTLQALRVKFVIRWVKKHIFYAPDGQEKKVWQIGRGKKYLAHTTVRDPETGEQMACDLWWTPIRHPHYASQLYLVKARIKKSICYLVTNERVQTEQQAWDIFFAYRRRWQIETSFRYGKCELAMESPRLWGWENRLKLLALVTLVYAFFLHLLHPQYQEKRVLLLRFKCHRTGKRYTEAHVPLYRLRWALARLWDDSHPILGSVFPPNLRTLQALTSFTSHTLVHKNSG